MAGYISTVSPWTAPVSHQKQPRQSETKSVEPDRKCSKTSEADRYPPAHNGLLAGSSPAEPTSNSMTCEAFASPADGVPYRKRCASVASLIIQLFSIIGDDCGHGMPSSWLIERPEASCISMKAGTLWVICRSNVGKRD